MDFVQKLGHVIEPVHLFCVEREQQTDVITIITIIRIIDTNDNIKCSAIQHTKQQNQPNQWLNVHKLRIMCEPDHLANSNRLFLLVCGSRILVCVRVCV